jgi:periplasmic protein TonB
MEANKIMQADVLDIIFEGRNKEYGAYELRTTYKKRLLIAVMSTMMICCLLLLLYFVADGRDKGKASEMIVADMQLEKIQPEEIEPPVVEPPKPQPEQVQVTQYTKPIIVDEDVKPDEAPPEMTELEDTKIGTIDQDGVKDDGIVAPPVKDDGQGIVEAPKKEEEDWEKTFISVQIESQYPGGTGAWARFLNRTLPNYYTGNVVEREIQGKVVVQFVVDKEGNVSEVHGIEGPKELWDIASKVIMKSGKWTPAIQNGRQVKSYKRQPIIFRLETE